MKIIGLIGGTSWASTIDYYRYLNEGINARLGGLEFARCIIHSLNFGDIQRNNEAGDWDGTLTIFIEAAQNLEKSGAAAIMIGANTMHKIADRLQEKIGIPIIHIGTVTAEAVVKKGLKKVALLGTKYTMQMDFFKDKLSEQHIETIIPGKEDIKVINDAIYNELSVNIFTPETKKVFLNIMETLKNEGVEGIILGCTEIPMLIKQKDFDLPLFDTTFIHAEAAVNYSLAV